MHIYGHDRIALVSMIPTLKPISLLWRFPLLSGDEDFICETSCCLVILYTTCFMATVSKISLHTRIKKEVHANKTRYFLSFFRMSYLFQSDWMPWSLSVRLLYLKNDLYSLLQLWNLPGCLISFLFYLQRRSLHLFIQFSLWLPRKLPGQGKKVSGFWCLVSPYSVTPFSLD